MVRRLKTTRTGASTLNAPREKYNDYHDDDTNEEIVMEALPAVAAPAPVLIIVSDGEEEEGQEEVIPEGEGEEQVQDNDQDQVEKGGEQEKGGGQADQQALVAGEPAEEVI
jgi:hypothetical protein